MERSPTNITATDGKLRELLSLQTSRNRLSLKGKILQKCFVNRAQIEGENSSR